MVQTSALSCCSYPQTYCDPIIDQRELKTVAQLSEPDSFSRKNNAFELYGVQWMKEARESCHILRAQVVEIDAPIETVWQSVCNLNHYSTTSHGLANAQIDGEVAVGKVVNLWLSQDSCPGKLIGVSQETISIFDPRNKIIAWSKDAPFGGGKTQRCQVLEEISPGRTRSYIAVRLPGTAGFFASLLFGRAILRSFNALQKGFKETATASSPESLKPLG